MDHLRCGPGIVAHGVAFETPSRANSPQQTQRRRPPGDPGKSGAVWGPRSTNPSSAKPALVSDLGRIIRNIDEVGPVFGAEYAMRKITRVGMRHEPRIVVWN